MGGDVVNAARSMMLALGCIQSKSCNTNNCPTGVATQNPARARAVDLTDKSLRVYNFHRSTVAAFLELCGAMGLNDPSELRPSHIHTRVDGHLRNYGELHTGLAPGQLLGSHIPDPYRDLWHRASATAF